MGFLDRLRQGPPILADGAMGTMLFAAGLPPGRAGETWVLERPEAIAAVHRAYVEAGAELILTCTFGGNRARLQRLGLGDRVEEVNRRAVELARAVTEGRNVWIAGDMGPLGELLAPLGRRTYAEAVESFAQQAAALASAGVDLLYIETLSDLREAQAAVEGARWAAPHLPLVVTFSFDTHGRTNMGVRPEAAVQATRQWQLTAVGANCGATLEMTEEALRRMREADPEAALVAKPNAGLPRFTESGLVYDATPQRLGEFARRVLDLGVRVLGGCCGTTPEHIRAMARAVRGEG
ncbi:MAG: homocysteine S-methyltransferase family protein [Armatimonadota bacterium]|nr:homocysteine S-methyltransferase family protein [Armatimonadota bacterium]MDR7439416.1 homocysteine S-methyltransferase family protein [Armatimonadota bacterium]MDR7563057.1 homocysteine S-methyltransferase family protein [Armatimonadota bacterium]MDR7568125.1 homocysteine S-methyltransferase family protein [Armatimonadota bacterium]MDR7602904.1 homocysteine S-methyltransferase family protein [Armatimonadota bacterium]